MLVHIPYTLVNLLSLLPIKALSIKYSFPMRSVEPLYLLPISITPVYLPNKNIFPKFTLSFAATNTLKLVILVEELEFPITL
jgi:hypothetical protein